MNDEQPYVLAVLHKAMNSIDGNKRGMDVVVGDIEEATWLVGDLVLSIRNAIGCLEAGEPKHALQALKAGLEDAYTDPNTLDGDDENG